MIELVLATHGPLAEAFVSSGKLIVGNIGNVAHLGLFHGDSIEQFEQKVYKAIEQADEGGRRDRFDRFTGRLPLQCHSKGNRQTV